MRISTVLAPGAVVGPPGSLCTPGVGVSRARVCALPLGWLVSSPAHTPAMLWWCSLAPLALGPAVRERPVVGSVRVSGSQSQQLLP